MGDERATDEPRLRPRRRSARPGSRRRAAESVDLSRTARLKTTRADKAAWRMAAARLSLESRRDGRGRSARTRIDLDHGVHSGAPHASRSAHSPGRGLPGAGLDEDARPRFAKPSTSSNGRDRWHKRSEPATASPRWKRRRRTTRSGWSTVAADGALFRWPSWYVPTGKDRPRRRPVLAGQFAVRDLLDPVDERRGSFGSAWNVIDQSVSRVREHDDREVLPRALHPRENLARFDRSGSTCPRRRTAIAPASTFARCMALDRNRMGPFLAAAGRFRFLFSAVSGPSSSSPAASLQTFSSPVVTAGPSTRAVKATGLFSLAHRREARPNPPDSRHRTQPGWHRLQGASAPRAPRRLHPRQASP